VAERGASNAITPPLGVASPDNALVSIGSGIELPVAYSGPALLPANWMEKSTLNAMRKKRMRKPVFCKVSSLVHNPRPMKHSLPRRPYAPAGAISIALGAGLAALLTVSALGQTYPDRPIKIVVAEVGTQSHLMARAIAPSLERALGQPVVIDNRGGAGGTIGAQRVVQARADGYTLLVGGVNNIVLATLLRADVPYAPATDLVPLGGIARVPYGIAIASGIPAENLTEFIAYARAHPGKLSFASSGTGSSSQLAIELLKSRASVDILHVPYRNTVGAIPDLISGRIDVLAGDLALLMRQAKQGPIRLIAVTGARRAEAMPDLPTVAEQGFPGYAVEPWSGLFAPAGIPADVEEMLSRALADALRSEDVRRQFATLGYEPLELSGTALRAMISTETIKYGRVLDGVRIQQ
jgi:tripartite-type tricarboxylate transporter receptor subunit TctC